MTVATASNSRTTSSERLPHATGCTQARWPKAKVPILFQLFSFRVRYLDIRQGWDSNDELFPKRNGHWFPNISSSDLAAVYTEAGTSLAFAAGTD